MKIISALLCCVLFIGSLISAEPIGKVIAVEGKAQANERSLTRGASIFISDLIKVAASSKLQIRFSDGGMLNLIERTEYRINTYEFNKEGKNEYSAELAKGGFRALSGSIGNANPDGYNVKTPVATIGIRGTIFEANIVNGETFFGCENGQISVRNAAGERILSPGEFVSASSPRMLGDITTVRPDALREAFFTPPVGGQALEQQQAPIDRRAAEQEKKLEVNEDEGNPPC
jgi:hypothetical protein